jgi:hypothetical protein
MIGITSIVQKASDEAAEIAKNASRDIVGTKSPSATIFDRIM